MAESTKEEEMVNLRRTVAALAMGLWLGVPSVSEAAQVTGKVVNVWVFVENFWATVTMDSNKTGVAPACQGMGNQRSFSFRVNNDAGKAWLSIFTVPDYATVDR